MKNYKSLLFIFYFYLTLFKRCLSIDFEFPLASFAPICYGEILT